MVDSRTPLQGAQVFIPAWELRSSKSWCAAKRQTYFFLHPHHQAVLKLSLFKSLQEFLVTLRVSFICQFRKLQLLIIQTHTKVGVLEMESKTYHQLTLKWLSKMIWVNRIQSICGPHSISWKGFLLDLSLPWRNSNSLCWRVPACTTDLGSPRNYVSHFLLFYLLLVFLTEPYFSHRDNSLPVTCLVTI